MAYFVLCNSAKFGPDAPSGHALRACPRINSAQSGTDRATWRKPRISLALHPGYGCLLRRGHRARRDVRAGAVALVDIVDHHRLELGGDVGAAQGAEFLAVDEHRRRRGFAGAGQGDTDVGMLRFAGTIDDAAHDRDVERFNTG